MEIFENLEALIDAPGAETVNEARSMLRQFESVVTADAIHQFLLDLMTLVFVVDAAPQNYHPPVRKLVKVRLAMLKMLGEASV
ncbi:hypothetical protein LCM4576_31415 [Mesorhizobium sp. LCM 4576]|uniref:hypothetical protein n=1 Tax=Mesorhizobium sp. LCM 4576 TaxID=1848289 RepID=UPI0008DB125F|nr:hypothetical protein [Mesorhizobium sp. LCM 4576]OHV62929.1 hypothetical protein LCM4576_31415 [Mesorhizobium sp. LCM 4576]